jgi:hypothetical protein
VTLVVSDTSPIRALEFLGILPVLGKMYGSVVVPPTVQSELESPRPRFAPIDLRRFDFIEVRAPRDVNQVKFFLQSLDLGESEALALAMEIGAEAVLVDESAGRQAATQHGIPWLGTIGILLQAKSDGRLEQIRPLVDRLINELGFFVSDELRQRVLKLAGE